MPYQSKVSRRSFLKTATAGAAGVLTYTFHPLHVSAADELVVGALYVGPKTDYGWNQAHAEGVATLKKLGVKVVEEERVPETIQVAKSMESMIKLDKATLIFATSFGYWDQMLKTAEKYPNVQFLHAAPTVWKEGMPKNAGSYNGYIDEAQYISGIIAGLRVEKRKIGFCRSQALSGLTAQHQLLHPGRAHGQPEGDHTSHIHR